MTPWISLAPRTSALALAVVALVACGSGGSTPTEPSALTEDAVADTTADSRAAQFDGRVTAVDRSARTMTLANGARVRVNRNTAWDPLGDLFGFTQLANAFDAGALVRVEGDGNLRPDGAILATQIKAEVDD